jgi:hypothetical protein
MHKKPYKSSENPIFVNHSLLSIILIFTVFFLSAYSFAASRTIDLSLSLYINAKEGSMVDLNGSKKPSGLMEIVPSIFLDNRQATITQLSESKIRFDFKEAIRIGYYGGKESGQLDIKSFVATDTPENIYNLMSLKPGTLFTRHRFSYGPIMRFTRSLSPMGFSQAMADFIEDGPPVRILKTSKMSVSLNVDDLLSGDVKFNFVHYISDIIIGSRFYDIPVKTVLVSLDSVKEILDSNDSRIADYIEAYQMYKKRFLQIYSRGWVKGLLPREDSEFDRLEENPKNNVVPLFSNALCKHLFKSK